MSNGSFVEPLYQQAFTESLSGGTSVRIPVSSTPQKLDNAYVSRIVTTSSSISSMFTAATSIIDFNLNPSGVNINTSCYCVINVSSGATACAVMPTYLWFNYIEVQIDGSTIAQVYPVDSMWQYLSLNTEEYVRSTQNLMGYTGAGQAFTPYVQAANTSFEYIVNLNNLTPYLTSGILNDAVRSSLRLRFHVAPISQILSSTANVGAALTCSNFQIIQGGIALDGSALLRSRLNYQAAMHIFPCTVTQQRILNPGALTANIASGRITINSSQGLFSGIQTQVVDLSGITVDDLMSPEALNSLSFFDAGGSNINFEDTRSRLLNLNASTFPLSICFYPNASTRNAFYVPFSTHFRSSLMNLGSSGAFRFLGSEQVQITPAASLTNAQITLFMYQVAQISLDQNGVLVFSVRS